MLKFSQGLLLTSYLPVVLYFDCYIEWDGSTRTQFSMSKFPVDGTYQVKLNNGEIAGITVQKKSTVFLFRDNCGFRGQIIFPNKK
ncbi:MAG: hypothetical protein MGF17_01320 [Trichodesmium sp. MAG_R04]|nr:hypothetical protein [Trichodesmium sp. MAG_R04]